MKIPEARYQCGLPDCKPAAYKWEGGIHGDVGFNVPVDASFRYTPEQMFWSEEWQMFLCIHCCEFHEVDKGQSLKEFLGL